MVNNLTNTKFDLQATSVYDYNELTIQDLLIKFFRKINENIDLVNKNEQDIKEHKEFVNNRLETQDTLIENRLSAQDFKIDEFITYMKEEGVPPLVIETINTMYDDGRIKEIIDKLSNDVFTDLENYKKQTNSQLVQKTDKITTNNIQQQVNNLVLGAVGDGNNAEVIQARGKYTNLNDRLDNEFSYLSDFAKDVFFEKNYGFIELNGAIKTYDNNYIYTNLLKFKKDKKYIIKVEGWSNIAILSEYTSSGEFKKVLICGEEKEYIETYTYMPTDDIYVKISGKINGFEVVEVACYTTNDDVNKIAKNTSSLEVIDARGSYNSLNDRLNSKFNYLDEFINNIKYDINYGFIELNGVINSYDNRFMNTNLLLFKKDKKYIIKVEGWSNIAILSEYTSSGEFKKVLICGEEKEYIETYTYMPTDDIYVKISGKINGFEVVEISNYLTKIDLVSDNLLYKDITYLLSDSNKGYYTMNGVYKPDSYQTYRTTDSILLKKGEKLNIKYQLYTGVPALTIWSKEGDFIESLFEGDELETPKNVDYIATSDVYIKVTINIKFNGYSVIIKDKIIKQSDLPLSFMNDHISFKWCVIGDSLTQKDGRSTKFYHEYIAEELKCDVTNLGASGKGYKNNEFASKIPIIPKDIDVVTIFGSGNDLPVYTSIEIGNVEDTLSSNTLCGYINNTIDKFYESFPTTPLGIITPTPWVDFPPSHVGNEMDLYCEKLIEICKRRSIPCLDLYHNSNLRPWDKKYRELVYSRDGGNGVHPNEIGHKIISSKIREFLKTLI